MIYANTKYQKQLTPFNYYRTSTLIPNGCLVIDYDSWVPGHMTHSVLANTSKALLLV